MFSLMKKMKAKALQGHKDVFDLEGNKLPRWDIMREIVKSRPKTEKEESSQPDPIAQTLVSLVQEMGKNSVLSEGNTQKLMVAILATIQQIKNLSESINISKEPAKKWKFKATKTISGFEIDAERME